MTDSPLTIGGVAIEPGENRDLRLEISQTYTGDEIRIPLRVIRATKPGPCILVTAAIHGDEINGTGIIHDFLFGEPFEILRGTVVLAPVINVFGFEAHQRYLPDRRDLNRSFPGSPTGSLASRFAWILMTELVDKCDYAIDLHTAAFQRTNYPNIRADLTRPEARKLAKAFGCALIVDGKGPLGSFRREATRRGCTTIILEAGEPWKIEPSVLQIGVQGIRSVLSVFDMLKGEPIVPPYQTTIRKSSWIRATVGGILKFHVGPGEFVDQDQPIATNYSILGREQNVLTSPESGIVLGMTTMPAVKPGEPVCHIATVTPRQLMRYRKMLTTIEGDPHRRARRHLATNLDVVAADPEG